MRIVYLFAACAFLAGCAVNRPVVSIDAISSPDAVALKNYVIAPNAKSGELEYAQYVAQVEQVLAQKGFIKASDRSHANLAVSLSVEVSDAKTETRSGITPTWGQTGYSGSQTYGSLYGNMYQSSTHYTPTYGITGYVPYTNSITYYVMGFSLGAWAKTADGKDIRQVWNITVASKSRDADLRSAFPRMLRASVPYIAADTHGVIKLQVPPD